MQFAVGCLPNHQNARLSFFKLSPVLRSDRATGVPSFVALILFCNEVAQLRNSIEEIQSQKLTPLNTSSSVCFHS